MKIALLLALVTSAAWSAPARRDPLSGGILTASQMKFEVQSNGEPWPTSACTHKKDANGNPYDWDVQCDGDAGKYRFRAHVALTKYPQTLVGKNGYELLYWVTDLGSSPIGQHSVTQWIHHRDGTDPVIEYQTALGVRDDQSSLSLTVRLR